jgi:hypothetical protein
MADYLIDLEQTANGSYAAKNCYITIREFAEQLRTSESAIRRYIQWSDDLDSLELPGYLSPDEQEEILRRRKFSLKTCKRIAPTGDTVASFYFRLKEQNKLKDFLGG